MVAALQFQCSGDRKEEEAALQFQCSGDRKEEGGVEHVDFQDDTFCSSDSGGSKIQIINNYILIIPRTVII